MGIPSGSIAGGNRLDSQSHRLLERFLRAGAQTAQDGLELGERLLDGVEIRGVRWQEEQRKSRSQPRAASASRMLAALCALRLSMTTICPGRSRGANCSRIYHSKVSVVIALSTSSQGSCNPSGVSAATSVVFLPWLRGTAPAARWSWGAQP
jgi:hypothetical protein